MSAGMEKDISLNRNLLPFFFLVFESIRLPPKGGD